MKRFIYGAGKYGKLLLQYMISINNDIDCFVQTEEPILNEVEGIPVISYKEFNQIEGKKIVYIAVDNTRIAKEIEKMIYSVGNSGIKVYQCATFINDNLLTIFKSNQEQSRAINIV